MDDTAITPELYSAIETVVRDELGRFGIKDVEVIGYEDHQGSPAILVTVYYAAPNPEPEPKAMSNLVFRLNTMLMERKEPRFAYIMHRDPEWAERPRRKAVAG